MNNVIFKYALELTDEQIIELPYGANILSCGQINGQMFLWAHVDDQEQRKVGERISIRGTGQGTNQINAFKHKFIGTVVVTQFVWHIWVETYERFPRIEVLSKPERSWDFIEVLDQHDEIVLVNPSQILFFKKRGSGCEIIFSQDGSLYSNTSYEDVSKLVLGKSNE